jgi:hypothetical protein
MGRKLATPHPLGRKAHRSSPPRIQSDNSAADSLIADAATRGPAIPRRGGARARARPRGLGTGRRRAEDRVAMSTVVRFAPATGERPKKRAAMETHLRLHPSASTPRWRLHLHLRGIRIQKLRARRGCAGHPPSFSCSCPSSRHSYRPMGRLGWRKRRLARHATDPGSGLGLRSASHDGMCARACEAGIACRRVRPSSSSWYGGGTQRLEGEAPGPKSATRSDEDACLRRHGHGESVWVQERGRYAELGAREPKQR